MNELHDQEIFRLYLKYPECDMCGNKIYCRWGCTIDIYPKGFKDYTHSRWLEMYKAVRHAEFLRNGVYNEEYESKMRELESQ